MQPPQIELEENIQPTETPSPPSGNELPPPYDPGEGEGPVITSQDYTESPPLYSDVVKLPTYNESENIESEDENNSRNRSVSKAQRFFLNIKYLFNAFSLFQHAPSFCLGNFHSTSNANSHVIFRSFCISCKVTTKKVNISKLIRH